jgi:hypothetical protein
MHSVPTERPVAAAALVRQFIAAGAAARWPDIGRVDPQTGAVLPGTLKPHSSEGLEP